MNLIRLIKLKKINGELDDLTENEKYFLRIFDELKGEDNTYYNQKRLVIFRLDLKNKTFYYSFGYLYFHFEKLNINMNNFNINDILYNILENKLNLSGIEMKPWI